MSLANATRSEVTKQFTTAGWWVIGIILAVYLVIQAGFLSSAMAFSASEQNSTALGTETTGMLYSVAASSGYIFPLLFGTLMVTTEFRHKLIVPTFLATPRRGTALTAKFIAGTVIGAIYGVIAVVTTAAVVFVALSLFGLDTDITSSDTWIVLAKALLALVLWALVGIGVGSVIRNQVAAIVVILAFTMLIEPVLRFAAMLVEWMPAYTKWLPGAATEGLVGHNMLSMGGSATDMLPWWGGALVLVGYAVVFSVIGALTTWRRDVS